MRQHWLTSAYTQFAVPYFIYDIYAMFLCHWHKYRVKGHEGAGPRSLRTVTCAFLHKEFLMVLHHLCMVLVCFPVSVLWRQGKGDFFLGCMLRPSWTPPSSALGKVLICTSGSTPAAQGERAPHAGDLFCCRILLFLHVLGLRAPRRAALHRVPSPCARCNLGAACSWRPALRFGLICRGPPASPPEPGPRTPHPPRPCATGTARGRRWN
nr:ceramide synthase-like [Chelonoidis abingdonii]